jgi:hypothetical protein
MNDFDKLAQEATKRAAISVGKDAAKRAVDGLLGPEGADAKAAGDASAAKTRRWKIFALVALGLCLVVGLVGLLLSYWYWFLAAGVVGVAGLVGWSRLKAGWARRKAEGGARIDEAAAKEPPAIERSKVARAKVGDDEVDATAEAEREAAAEAEARRTAAKARAEAAARARAAEEARVQREHEVDEELAAMKARLKK